MTHKGLLVVGIAFLICGAVPLTSHSLAINILQGLAYIFSGLFAFAALMQGQSAQQRFARIGGWFYLILALGGMLSPQGKIFGVFMMTATTNVLNLIFAAALLALTYATGIFSRRLAGQHTLT